MTAVLGLDPQRSRTCLILRETAGTATAVTPVGDGHRRLVPNAVRGDAWGSPAAGNPADPWGVPFLRGVRERVAGYLGLRGRDHTRAYQVCLALGPSAPDRVTTLARCRAAGLPEVTLADPVDALVCRRLVEPGHPVPSGMILVVACGEAWTSAAVYRAGPDAGHPARVRRVAGPLTAPQGAGPVTDRLARAVQDRTVEGVYAALEVEDGVLEYGALLRHHPADEPVQWQGPLADRMFAPLRLSAAELRGWPEAGRLADTMTGLADRLLDGAEPAAIVVGGPGAVLPCVPEALGRRGALWQSPEPELDLAVGAAWWPGLRHVFDLPNPAWDPLPHETAADTTGGQVAYAATASADDLVPPLDDPEDELPPSLRP